MYLPTTRTVRHPPSPDRGGFVLFLCIPQQFFLPQYKCFLSLLSRHAPNGSPSNLPLLGGLSSQQDVPPKRGLGRNREIDTFPFPHHQTIPPLPLTSYLWPMAPPCPILAGYRLVVPGPCACFPFRYVQESACCSCVCRDLETLRLRFLTLHVGFSLVSHSIQELGFV